MQGSHWRYSWRKRTPLPLYALEWLRVNPGYVVEPATTWVLWLSSSLSNPSRSQTEAGFSGPAPAGLPPGGPVSTVGTYSSSCSRPSKVRLSTISNKTSG